MSTIFQNDTMSGQNEVDVVQDLDFPKWNIVHSNRCPILLPRSNFAADTWKNNRIDFDVIFSFEFFYTT